MNVPRKSKRLFFYENVPARGRSAEDWDTNVALGIEGGELVLGMTTIGDVTIEGGELVLGMTTIGDVTILFDSPDEVEDVADALLEAAEVWRRRLRRG
jgi:hypothetical protein